MEYRTLGTTEIKVSTVALGCWPIAGMTSADVNDTDSLATLRACLEDGINFLDTAYCYGQDGQSERLIAQALSDHRDQLVIASKGGIHWGPDRKQILDARPRTLRDECETSLQRLKTDRIDLYYLHAPDPQTPVAESAGALRELLDEGKIRSVGASNLTRQQLEAFAAACPLTAYQPPYNLLQRDIENEILPWCRDRQVSVVVYWPLMKGLLTGKFQRNHQFPPSDGRAKYPMFHGDEWQRNQDFVEELRALADETGRTVAQLAIHWVLCQPGITAALCGAKRASQVHDNAGAVGWRLSDAQRTRIDEMLSRRGVPNTRAPV